MEVKQRVERKGSIFSKRTIRIDVTVSPEEYKDLYYYLWSIYGPLGNLGRKSRLEVYLSTPNGTVSFSWDTPKKHHQFIDGYHFVTFLRGFDLHKKFLAP